MIREGLVTSRQGALIHVTAMTACIHGDTPGSADFARRLRAALGTAGIAVAPLARSRVVVTGPRPRRPLP
jgi:UPF0271 protein